MENHKILLGRIGEWSYSEYYFDTENRRFIEERYHEEYLDTGTIFDGSDILSAQQVYSAFAKVQNHNAIIAMLECVDKYLLPQP